MVVAECGLEKFGKHPHRPLHLIAFVPVTGAWRPTGGPETRGLSPRRSSRRAHSVRVLPGPTRTGDRMRDRMLAADTPSAMSPPDDDGHTVARSLLTRLASRVGPAWWAPLAVVTLALLALGVLPTIVARRVGVIRRHVDLVIDPARRAAVDIQRAALEDILATGGQPMANLQPDTLSGVADDITMLDSLVPRADPTASPMLRQLHHTIALWVGTDSRFRCTPIITTGELVGLRCRTAATPVIRAATDLMDALDAEAEVERSRARAIERWDVVLPVLLVPLAVLAACLVGWSALQLRRMASEAARARDRLAAIATDRARLVRGVTHDLRNPIGAALSYTELLADGIVDPLTARQADLVTRLGRLLKASLEGMAALLDWSRTDVADVRSEVGPVELAATLRDIATDHAAAAERAGLTVRLDVGDGVCPVHTDARAVRRIVDNLLSNAVKYTPRGGVVVVGIRTGRDAGVFAQDMPLDADRAHAAARVAIVVEDTGPGIPESARETVFTEFVRLGNSHAPGAGVGLAVSRGLARALGGDITVRDRPGGGSIFAFVLSANSERYTRLHPAL